MRIIGLHAMTLLPHVLIGSHLYFLGTELDRAISAAYRSIHVQIQREFTFFRADLKAQYTHEVQIIQDAYQSKLARAESKFKADLQRERSLNRKKLKHLTTRANSTSSAKLRNGHHSSNLKSKPEVETSTLNRHTTASLSCSSSESWISAHKKEIAHLQESQAGVRSSCVLN